MLPTSDFIQPAWLLAEGEAAWKVPRNFRRLLAILRHPHVATQVLGHHPGVHRRVAVDAAVAGRALNGVKWACRTRRKSWSRTCSNQAAAQGRATSETGRSHRQLWATSRYPPARLREELQVTETGCKLQFLISGQPYLESRSVLGIVREA